MKILRYSISERTESWRFRMGENPEGYGTNAHAVPEVLRSEYVPPPGHAFGHFDLANPEGRYVGYRARCKYLISVFEDPTRNLHKENGTYLAPFVGWKLPIEKGTPQYRMGKETIHAAHYDESAATLARKLGIKLAVTRQLLEAYHRRCPEIRQVWHAEVDKVLAKQATLTTPFGHERQFIAAACAPFDRKGRRPGDERREAIAWEPQTVAPYITNKGMVALFESGLPLRIHHQWHDAVTWSCAEDVLPLSINVVAAALQVPITLHGRTFFIPAEFSWGYNWGMMVPWTGEKPEFLYWRHCLLTEYQRKSKRERVLEGTYGSLFN